MSPGPFPDIPGPFPPAPPSTDPGPVPTILAVFLESWFIYAAFAFNELDSEFPGGFGAANPRSAELERDAFIAVYAIWLLSLALEKASPERAFPRETATALLSLAVYLVSPLIIFAFFPGIIGAAAVYYFVPAAFIALDIHYRDSMGNDSPRLSMLLAAGVTLLAFVGVAGLLAGREGFIASLVSISAAVTAPFSLLCIAGSSIFRMGEIEPGIPRLDWQYLVIMMGRVGLLLSLFAAGISLYR